MLEPEKKRVARELFLVWPTLDVRYIESKNCICTIYPAKYREEKELNYTGNTIYS